ncbi:MAG: PadR family transcriptional regulator [Candidatus Thermoplasmatota archaeon]|nr:PadR family transcriptional regulator [Candidatus Thermoplasmatota archaeon]MCL5790493.1 PadR family transcriptional regulator [Candidatus Thermoplasmatota archaeon]
MTAGEYLDSALFIISLKPMSGYELSRKLKWDGSMVSGGTIRPLLKSLEKQGFITYDTRGRAKVYRLTPKGERYVSNLRLFRETMREKMLKASMGRDILFPDVLVDIEDTTILNEAIEEMAYLIIKQVKIAFALKKKGDDESLVNLKNMIERDMSEILEARRTRIHQ